MQKHYIISMFVALTATFFLFPLNGQNTPKQGDLIITEFMANPAMVSDTKGEWIEIFNTTDTDIILNGLIISDTGSNKHTLSSDDDLIISAGGFFLMARNNDPGENGGMTPDYKYKNFSLSNAEDEIILSMDDQTILDELAYNSDWPSYSGASLELDPGVLNPEDNDTPDKWHPAVDVYGEGDFGTPGLYNSVSNNIFNQEEIVYFEAFPNPTQGELYIRFSTSSNDSVRINIMNVLGQKAPILQEVINQSVVVPLDLSEMGSGIYWLEAIVGKKKYVQKIIKQ